MDLENDSVYDLFKNDLAGSVFISYFNDHTLRSSSQVTLHEGLTDEDEGVRRMAMHIHLNRHNYDCEECREL